MLLDKKSIIKHLMIQYKMIGYRKIFQKLLTFLNLNIIEVNGKTGKVVDINLRYVTMETDETRALVPNSISVSKIVLVHK